MVNKKLNKEYNSLILGILGGLISGIFVLSATEVARIARLNGYELWAKWLRVIFLTLPLFLFIRLYRKDNK